MEEQDRPEEAPAPWESEIGADHLFWTDMPRPISRPIWLLINAQFGLKSVLHSTEHDNDEYDGYNLNIPT